MPTANTHKINITFCSNFRGCEKADPRGLKFGAREFVCSSVTKFSYTNFKVCLIYLIYLGTTLLLQSWRKFRGYILLYNISFNSGHLI